MALHPSERLPIGKRPPPALLDEYAAIAPEKLAAIFPTSRRGAWHELTYSGYAKSVDSLAWFIEARVGKVDVLKPKPKPIAYLGLDDFRYPIFWLAAMKCGYAVFNPSVRNSTAEHLFLLKESGCSTIFYSEEMSGHVDAIKAAAPTGSLEVVLVSSLIEILAGLEVQRPYQAPVISDPDWLQRPIIILHTSGSTGLPKLRTLTYGYMVAMDLFNLLPVPEGRRQAQWLPDDGDKYFSMFPFFHNAGLIYNFYIPLYTGAVAVMPSTSSPITADTFNFVANQYKLGAAYVTASFLDDAHVNPESMKHFASLKFLIFGGPLPEKVGDQINEIAQLLQHYGSTEISAVPTLVNKHWQYIEPNPHFGACMEPVDETGLYEMVIRKTDALRPFQAVFYVFPEAAEYTTSDLFARHPSNSNLYRFCGRKDDVIVLSNGEKVSPALIESHLCENPLVSACIVVGQGRTQAALLVEPNYKTWDACRPKEDFVNEIWPCVQEANKTASATSQIFKSKIIVVTPERPFVRVGHKALVARKRTINEFKDAIDDVYANLVGEVLVPLPSTIDFSSMKDFVRKSLSWHMSTSELEDDTDFFAANMDSLQTMGFVGIIRAAIKAALPDSEAETLTLATFQKMVYQNSSISMMASQLLSILGKPHDSEHLPNGVHTSDAERDRQLDAMVETYTSDLIAQRTHTTHEVVNVILTGSTGSVGTWLLHELCSSSRVSMIYCLNRNQSAAEIAQNSFQANGLDVASLKKARFLHVSFGKPEFGLDDAAYTTLKDNAHLIIHNAWTVNFNHVLKSFEDPHIKGVRHFVDLNRQGRWRPHIFFISTIGAISAYPLGEQVPEVIYPQSDYVPRAGYSEGKYVSERILATAARNAGVSASVLRLGQAAGPTGLKGCWNRNDLLPILVKTSKALGALPDTLGPISGDIVDWVPLDTVAKVCTELAFYAHDARTAEVEVFHLVNPHVSSWLDLIPTVVKHFASHGSQVEVVSFEEWMARLHKVHISASNSPDEAVIKQFPALRLLNFFGSSVNSKRRPTPSTKNTVKLSKSLAGLRPVGPELMTRWLDQWNF